MNDLHLTSLEQVHRANIIKAECPPEVLIKKRNAMLVGVGSGD